MNGCRTVEKERELLEVIDRTDSNLVCVVETHFRNLEQPALYAGQKWYGSNRMDGEKKGGGMGFLAKNNTKTDIWKECKEHFWLRTQDLFVAVVYCDASSDKADWNKEIRECLNRNIADINQVFRPNILVVGDFNAHIEEFDGEDREGRELKAFATRNELAILNLSGICQGRVTWQRGDQRSTIDYALCNGNLKPHITRLKIDELAEMGISSDHNCLVLDINTTVTKAKQRTRGARRQDQGWDFRKPQALKAFTNELEEELERARSPQRQGCYTELMEKIVRIGKKNCKQNPRPRNRASNPRWFTKTVRQAIITRKQANRAVRKAVRDDIPKECRDRLWTTYKEAKEIARRKVSQSIRTVDKELEETLTRGGPEATRKFWRYLKRNQKEENHEGLTDELGTTHYDEHKIREIIEAFYRSPEETQAEDLFPEEAEELLDQQQKELLKEITVSEVGGILRNLKAGKAAGPDNIPNELLSNLGPRATEYLTECLNYFWGSNTTDESWKTAHIRLVYKGKNKDRKELEAYRPIALLCTTYKIYMSIWRTRLSQYLENSRSLGDLQNGFRPNRNAEDSLFTVTQAIEQAGNLGKQIFIAFLDFKGAYDHVDQRILWHRLRDCRIPNRLIAHLRSCYKGSQNIYRWEEVETTPITCAKGVRQGCPLSPTLFTVFLNPLEGKIAQKGTGFRFGRSHEETQEECDGAFFADDVTLTSDSERGLQWKMTQTGKFAEESRAAICPDKSIVMIFGKAEPKHLEALRGTGGDTRRFHIGEKEVKIVTLAKYLGVWLNSEEDNYLRTHEEKLTSKAIRYKNVIKQASRNSFNRPTVVRTLWKQVAVPSLTYATAAIPISSTCIAGLDKEQFDMGKFALGGTFLAPKTGVEGEMGWSCFAARDASLKNNMEGKILRKSEESTNKKLYRFNSSEANKTNWAKKTQRARTRFHITANLVKEDNQAKWRSRVKRDVRKTNELRWKQEVQKKTSMEHYQVKPKIEWRPIYDNSLGSDLLFQARTGSLPTGARQETLYNLPATCKLCLHPREDVQHILLSCPALVENRGPPVTLTEAQMTEEIRRRLGFLERDPQDNNITVETTKKTLERWWNLTKKRFPYWRTG